MKQMRVVRLQDIKPYKNNAKIHSPEQIQQLKKSIEENGYIQPLVLDGENTIVIGHGRFEALKLIRKPDDDIEVVDVSDFTANKIKKLRILDNKIVSDDYDFKLLEREIKSIYYSDTIDFDQIMEETGLAHSEIDDMFKDDLSDDDDVLPDNIITITKPGDLWELDNHRLLCGDSRNNGDIEYLMNGKKADMVFTDPPYGIDYAGARSNVIKKRNYGKMKNDDLVGFDLGQLIKLVFHNNKPAADVYICVSPIRQKPFFDFIESQNKTIDAVIVWDKRNAGLGHMAYRRQTEFILFVKGGAFKMGDTSDYDLWSIPRDNALDYQHGTQKPIALSTRAIINSSKMGDIVKDLFIGSGSTLIASAKINRVCYGMELDPHYCDISRDRYIEYCKKQNIKYNVKLNGKPWSE